MTLLDTACSLIKRFEGFSATPYLHNNDGHPTIGWGCTMYEHGQLVSLTDPPISADRAEQLLGYFVQEALDQVQNLVLVDFNDNQLAALTSFEYNTGGLAKSGLLEKLNENDIDGAMDELLRWTHSKGKLLPGLVTRREDEKELFLTEE